MTTRVLTARQREIDRLEREAVQKAARKFPRFHIDARAAARGDDHAYRLGPGAKPLHPALIVLDLEVWAGGRPGRVTAIAHSLATDQMLVTVAHDPRIRLTYPAGDIYAAP